MDTCIIIVNWNNPTDTLECIKSVNDLYGSYYIIVIDNCSTDDSVTIIKEHFPDICLIQAEKNLGYGGAINMGIKHGMMNNIRYSLILNNDVILDKYSLFYMLKLVKSDSNIAIVGPKIYFYDDRNLLYSAGGIIQKITGYNRAIGNRKYDLNKYNYIIEVDYVSGCAFLVDNKLISKIGFFDTRYFMYYEEIDLCIRLKQKGYKIIYTPKAIVWHKESATVTKISGIKEYYIARNRFILQKKFLNKFEYVLFILWLFIIWIPYNSLFLLLSCRQVSSLSYFFKGIVDGLKYDV